VQNGITLTNYL